MVNKTDGIFHDYRIYLPRKLRNKNDKTPKQSIKHYRTTEKTVLWKMFSKKWKNENLLDFIEKMTKMTKSKKMKNNVKKWKNDTLGSLNFAIFRVDLSSRMVKF